MEKGYLQVYTGNGKGKTTAMLGLTLRACGAGKKVYIGQFIKNYEYSEIKALKEFLPQVEIHQYGNGRCLIKKGKGLSQDIECATNGYNQALKAVTSGKYDIVILDEINVATYLELLDENAVIKLIESRPEQTELILTGRYAPQSFIDRADLVTEMKEIKHYYNYGVPARLGIEK
ncbi:MAG: cob(I)yrinic acid a,c-diamide adenosyltransferase [Oscillospiraceae bacterium]